MITREELDSELKSVSNANLNNAIRRIIIEDIAYSLDCSENEKVLKLGLRIWIYMI